jgi:acetyl esterase/lipase
MRLVAFDLALGLVILIQPYFETSVAASPRNTPAGEPIVLDLWPGPAPGELGTIPPETTEKATPTKAFATVTNISKPTISVYRPTTKPTDCAVIVCPGGGYNLLAIEHEGTEVAEWLNSLGVTAIVLKYRVPRREGTPRGEPPPQALMDAQRALSLVRSRASEWQLNPNRIGILGFSAGGHLSAWAACQSNQRSYETTDDADRVSCRPDFAILVYPGGMVKRDTIELNPQIRVGSDTPPMFLAHAGDDNVSPQNSVALYLALKEAKIPAELHIYTKGGHGYGLR